ncbi:MAG: S8 family serine peptidase, partial [Synergistota bacterium]|nr:S8 family serine peptidase [Synergistota bacterium]
MRQNRIPARYRPCLRPFSAIGMASFLLLASVAFAGSAHAIPGEYAPGEALVLMEIPPAISAASGEPFQTGFSSSARDLAESVGAHALQTYGAIAAGGGPGIVHIKSDTDDTQRLIELLSAKPGVIDASPNYISYGAKTPNDPLFGSLWGMKCINAPGAWDLSTGAEDVVVAVIDSGIDRKHEDLSANVVRDKDGKWGFDAVNKDRDPMDDQGHGTHVAGIIGATGNNGKGVAGVCWKVGLLAVKVLDAENRTFDSQIIAGINYLLDQKSRGMNIRAANMSITGWRQPIVDPEKNSYGAAVKALSDAGVVLVVAAGNEGQNLDLPEKFYDWQKF